MTPNSFPASSTNQDPKTAALIVPIGKNFSRVQKASMTFIRALKNVFQSLRNIGIDVRERQRLKSRIVGQQISTRVEF